MNKEHKKLNAKTAEKVPRTQSFNILCERCEYFSPSAVKKKFTMKGKGLTPK
jgi:hypothetical protein